MIKTFRCKVLAAAALAVLLPTSTWAATTPAEQAAEMMARAQAVDVKCNFLAAHEKDKLSKFTARAELALANRESTAETKAAMQRGHDAAQSAACSPEEKATIEQILAAALQAAGEEKQAAKLVAKPAPVAADSQPAPEKPAVADATIPMAPAKPEAAKPAPAPKLASAQPPLAPAPKPMKPVAAKRVLPTVSGLTAYENLTAAYFRARRCGGNQGAAYQAVVAEHGRVMHGHSAAAVAAAMHRGEARAQGSACS